MEELKKWVQSQVDASLTQKTSAQKNNNNNALLKANSLIEAYNKTLDKISEIENFL
jgi:hypothetical protein